MPSERNREIDQSIEERTDELDASNDMEAVDEYEDTAVAFRLATAMAFGIAVEEKRIERIRSSLGLVMNLKPEEEIELGQGRGKVLLIAPENIEGAIATARELEQELRSLMERTPAELLGSDDPGASQADFTQQDTEPVETDTSEESILEAIEQDFESQHETCEHESDMALAEDPHDFYRAIDDVRREARTHTDSLVAELRRESREDRRDTLDAISAGRREVLDEVRASRLELHEDINALSGRVQSNSDQILKILTGVAVLLAGLTVAGVIVGIAAAL